MGRNNTKAVKNISKMYEQLGLVQNDMFHKTIGEHLTRCDMDNLSHIRSSSVFGPISQHGRRNLERQRSLSEESM